MKITLDIPLPISQTGLTLKAALVNNNIVDPVFRELECTVLKDSIYHFQHDSLPDSFRGSLVFYTGIIGDNLSAITIRGSYALSGSIGASVGSTEVLP